LVAQVMRFNDRRESNAVMILAFALLLATVAGIVLSFFNVTRLLLRM
jgi:hypothetical protein